MPVGRLISMPDSEATSQGATSIDAKLALVTAGGALYLEAESEGWMDSRGFPSFTRDIVVGFGAAGASDSDSSSGCTDSFLLFLEPICSAIISSSELEPEVE